MFPDSAIAQNFQCGKTRCSYLIKFGLAPYFQGKLTETLNKSDCYYSLSFDESLNSFLQKEQMDLYVRFWDEESQKVVVRFFGSQYMGHTRASDLLEKLLESLEVLKPQYLLQISMDGPSTNWKLYDELVKHRSQLQLPSLINTGSCSLHVVHGSLWSC